MAGDRRLEEARAWLRAGGPIAELLPDGNLRRVPIPILSPAEWRALQAEQPERGAREPDFDLEDEDDGAGANDYGGAFSGSGEDE